MFARFVLAVLFGFHLCETALADTATTNVVTYHGDNLRTGWNKTETQLSPRTVGPATFGLLHTVALDEQIDAQPLVFNNVVYAVTANDTVYAINPSSGQILASLSLGAPVPIRMLPGNCINNSAVVGITSTPVIDPANAVMYVVAYALERGKPVYRLHRLQLPNSAANPTSAIVDAQSVVVSASHPLSDGSAISFTPGSQRQRAALLESNGVVYAAFASFCDLSVNKSRGWLLGWNATTLAPLAANELTDTQTMAQTPPSGGYHNFYLSSIWMSGYGIASDSSGDLFFITGNSDGNRTDNLAESAVRMAPDLTTVRDYFTPNLAKTWDFGDFDFGSGGVMIIPDETNFTYAVAEGKSGALYSLNRASGAMGKYAVPDAPPHNDTGSCWCGPSYYTGSDGIGRVITSTGANGKGGSWVTSFKVLPASRPNPLVYEASEELPATIQDGGFFTSVSSSGTAPKTQIIWAVARPAAATPTQLTLYALDGSASSHSAGGLPVLYSAPAGFWPNSNTNANIVPTVANGKVFVGSYKTLMIFGCKGSPPSWK